MLDGFNLTHTKKDAVFLQDKVKSSVPIRLWQRIDRALFQDSRHHDLEKIETGVINLSDQCMEWSGTSGCRWNP